MPYPNLERFVGSYHRIDGIEGRRCEDFHCEVCGAIADYRHNDYPMWWMAAPADCNIFEHPARPRPAFVCTAHVH